MIRYILLLFVLLFNIQLYSQNTPSDFGQCPYPPNGGNPSPRNTTPKQQFPLDNVPTSGGRSADPNEIIGPTGYDSLRWVSINDVLAYTILFENDPGFATANAQKVDVRFTFDDKSYIKGFGLSAFGFVRTSV